MLSGGPGPIIICLWTRCSPQLTAVLCWFLKVITCAVIFIHDPVLPESNRINRFTDSIFTKK